jgi:hypothetical protein
MSVAPAVGKDRKGREMSFLTLFDCFVVADYGGENIEYYSFIIIYQSRLSG